VEKPLFPTGDKPEVAEVADWCECVALVEQGVDFKRGDLKSAIAQEDIASPEILEEQVWAELIARAQIFGDRWPLVLETNRIRLRDDLSTDIVDLYRYLCLLGLGQAESDDRVLFEELVREIIGSRIGPSAVRVGHPASEGASRSFRERISDYAARSGLKRLEIGAPPFSNDKDLGLDVVFWLPSSDGRGADLHFLVQCATGRNWDSKLDDINLKEWSSHLNWAVPPVRIFCVPNVIRLTEERWIRTSSRAGWIVDRPRLIEFARNLEFDATIRATVSARIEDLSAA